MNLPEVLEHLRSRTELVTVKDIATLVGVNYQTVSRWVREKRDFPKPTTSDHVKQFRPDQVAWWIAEYSAEESRFITIDEVCARIGYCEVVYYRRMKSGDVPMPIRRALFTGRSLWDVKEVDAWKLKNQGGYVRQVGVAPYSKHHDAAPPRGQIRQRGPKHHRKTDLNSSAP